MFRGPWCGSCSWSFSLPPLPLPSETAGKQNQTIAQTLSSSSFSLSPAAPFWKDPPFLLPPSLFSSFRVSLRPLRCSRSYVHTHHCSTADRKERASFSPPSYSGPAAPLLPTLLGLSFTKQRRRAMVWGGGGGGESERRG